MAKEYKNILGHAIMNLGDVVLATSVVPIIKTKFPNAKVTFMVRSSLVSILENSDFIDEVIGYDYKSRGNYFSVYNFGTEFKKYNFDLSISLDSRFRRKNDENSRFDAKIQRK